MLSRPNAKVAVMSKPTRFDHGPVSPAQVICVSIRPGRSLITSSDVIWNRSRHPVAVKAFETASHYVDAIFGCGVGGLIHAAVGSFGGCGGVPNRFGLAA